MKTKRWIIPVAAIAIVVALSAPALILANFSAMSSRMERNSSIATSSGNAEASQPLNPAKTEIIVTGEGRLARSLHNQLTKNLENNPGFGQIQAAGEVSAPADSPLLMVEIEPQQVVWTPVYSRASVQVTVSYASNGDVSFRLEEPTKFESSSDEPTIQSSGRYSYNDTSWGLISRPGYMDYLAKEIGRQIAADLKAQNQ
jgi:hypothetical protein